MNCILSLTASAQTFDHIGETHTAETCRRMIRDCTAMESIFGPGAGDALHAAFASELAARAMINLIRHNRRAA